MTKAHSHLTDDQLIELCLAGDPPPSPGCAACDARHADLAALLADVSDAAAADADAAFPAERLARQQARILQRLEQQGRPARVIAFPGHPAEASTVRQRPAARWIAVAAVAGLVIGLAAGQLVHGIPGVSPAGTDRAPAVVKATDEPAQPGTLRAVATSFSEDEFLGQIESLADRPGGDALRSLHDLTPRAWEVK